MSGCFVDGPIAIVRGDSAGDGNLEAYWHLPIVHVDGAGVCVAEGKAGRLRIRRRTALAHGQGPIITVLPRGGGEAVVVDVLGVHAEAIPEKLEAHSQGQGSKG